MPEKSAGIIYKATNLVNGKCYIGQTKAKDPVKYWIKHLKGAFANKNTRRIFHNAIKKYGSENFMFEVLEFCSSKKEMDEMEFHYIKQYKSFKTENGYNMTFGGDGNIAPRSKETIDKTKKTWNEKILNGFISPIKNIKWTEERKTKKRESGCQAGENHHFFNKKCTPERAKRISEVRKLNGNSKGEKNPMYNKKHKKESIEKMRMSKLGKKRSKESIEKQKETWRNKTTPIKKCENRSYLSMKSFKIIFKDGTEIIIKGIANWCKENNYNYQRLRHNYKKWYKDIFVIPL